jgi:hypothetical protein
MKYDLDFINNEGKMFRQTKNMTAERVCDQMLEWLSAGLSINLRPVSEEIEDDGL